MANHSDPTANAAIGEVNREWKRMIKHAISLRKANQELTPETRRMFTGIYKHLLSEPVSELEKMSERK